MVKDISLIEQIEAERLKQELTMPELATKAGLADRTVYSRYINKRSDVTQAKLIKMAEVLGCEFILVKKKQ